MIIITPVMTGLRCFLESRGVNPAAVADCQVELCCLYIFNLKIVLFGGISPVKC